MPELPEVEAARRAIEDHCIGKKIKRSVIADDPKVIDGMSPADFEASLLGKTILAAHRKGKSMWHQLDSPPFPSFQFGGPYGGTTGYNENDTSGHYPMGQNAYENGYGVLQSLDS